MVSYRSTFTREGRFLPSPRFYNETISLLALTAICVKVAISANAMKDAGDGIPPAPIACGRRTLYDVREVMMQVRVKLFATLARYFKNVAPGTPFDIEVADGATLTDLVNRLKLPHEEVNPVRKDGA
jgi:hypothetical protein